jgi:hypothetical protein
MNEFDLFAAAIAIADPSERAALLERECAGRPDMRDRIDDLVSAHFKSNAPFGLPGTDEPTLPRADHPTAGPVPGRRHRASELPRAARPELVEAK